MFPANGLTFKSHIDICGLIALLDAPVHVQASAPNSTAFIPSMLQYHFNAHTSCQHFLAQYKGSSREIIFVGCVPI